MNFEVIRRDQFKNEKLFSKREKVVFKFVYVIFIHLLKMHPQIDFFSYSFSFRIAGTRWCGKGNSASSYYALGKFVEIDKCCRIHDNCPISINGGATEYGVKNDGKITL